MPFSPVVDTSHSRLQFGDMAAACCSNDLSVQESTGYASDEHLLVSSQHEVGICRCHGGCDLRNRMEQDAILIPKITAEVQSIQRDCFADSRGIQRA